MSDSETMDDARRDAIQWAAWEREEVEAKARAIQFDAYWERRHKDDEDLWRDKASPDFANAVDKVSRAGYKGQHGDFEVPKQAKLELAALFMQVTVGDYDGNSKLECAELWKTHKGKSRIEAQREHIRKTNEVLCRYGWNPPEGWS